MLKRSSLLFSIVLIILATFELNAQDSLMLRYSKTITASELSEHVYSLASPGLGGRYTGSEGQKGAAEYIKNDFRKIGLEGPFHNTNKPYYQEFSLSKCYWKNDELIAGGRLLAPIVEYVIESDPMDLSGTYETIFAGFGIEDSSYSDYGELDVKGKVVVAFSGEPKDKKGISVISGKKKSSSKSYYFSKVRTAKEKGAVGIIIIPQQDKAFKKYSNSFDYRADEEILYPEPEDDGSFFGIYTNIPAAATILNTNADKLSKSLDMMEKSSKTTAGEFHGQLSISSSKECYKTGTENVVGIIEGSDKKDEAVVVVAHYDHRKTKDGVVYPGADDNASGTAAVMELADAFMQARKDGNQPRRTIIFIAVTGEEIGLYGSRYYSEHPIIPLDKTIACVNIDMIGRVGKKMKSDPNYISGSAYLSLDILEMAQRNLTLMAPGYDFRMTYRNEARGGSDQYYFAKNGIPSLFYFTGIHKDYHEPSDTPDKILYDRMETITRSIFATVWELAGREEKLAVGQKIDN